MSALFSPMEYKDHAFENRVVLPPMATNNATDDGKVTDTIIEHYRERARAHIGTIIVEHTYVRSDGRVNDNQMGADKPDNLAGLRELAGAITGEGARAIIQLTHAGAVGLGDEDGTPRGAGRVPLPEREPTGHVQLCIDEMHAIRDSFVSAAEMCIEAGFDGVQLHGAHGYLLNQFLSPLTNDRDDEYGGNLDGRGKYPLEVARAVRDAMGDRPLLYYRLGADDLIDGGLTTDETGPFAAELVRAGVDIIDISGGLGGSRPDGAIAEGYFLPLACDLRAEVGQDVPLVLTGGVVTASAAESLVAEEGIDFVGVGRALLSNPDWATEARKILAD